MICKQTFSCSTGQSRNVTCKPWIAHFGSYFGRWFVLLILLVGPVFGMKLYIFGTAKFVFCLGAHLAALVREIRDIIGLPKLLTCPGTNNWALGRCSRTRWNLVKTYRWFCYALQYYWVGETLVSKFFLYIFCLLAPRRACRDSTRLLLGKVCCTH